MIVAGAALVAAAAYNLGDSSDDDGVADAVVESATEEVESAPVVEAAQAMRRDPLPQKQIRMNTEVKAARDDVMESMNKMATEAAKAMEAQGKSMKNSMGGPMDSMMGEPDSAIQK